jgi:hypothetical protein
MHRRPAIDESQSHARERAIARFETRFYLDDKRVLYVRGGGDPFLISEELARLAPSSWSPRSARSRSPASCSTGEGFPAEWTNAVTVA